ncbi:MAG: hypothetical protein IJ142_00445 [Bacteroidaceae bacterium]|nr:hypothetical protein [Bacteroidaceae bacterium]MBQ9190062.1 hypothetical protein [Bacteroidaceae bacterium]MBQ9560602.1 hypothetical protein [Bacteroidaceae bacterium]
METNEVMNPENVQGMFLCWLQVSRRMEKVMNTDEQRMRQTLLDKYVHRTITSETFRRMMAEHEKKLQKYNREVIESYQLRLEYSEPDEVSSGYIRISRENDPKAVMNVPIIDWRGKIAPYPSLS